MTNRIRIAQIASYLPGAPVTNEEIIARGSLRMKADWVSNRLGIEHRYWAGENESCSDLAVAAARKLDLSQFAGPIFLSTISPDYFTPSTASLVKGKLDLKDSSPVFDGNNSCSGLLFALENARSWLVAHDECREALVIAAEMRSKWLNKTDRRTAFLFGDGAVALRIEKSPAPGGIEWIETHTISSTALDIYVPGGGSAQPLTAEAIAQGKNFITMQDGQNITRMATEHLAEQIGSIMHRRGRNVSDFDVVISHQANQMVNEKLFQLLSVQPGQIFSNLRRTGNCSSASIGLALTEAANTGRLKPGTRLLMISMGAGYHFAVASILWGDK